jgi:hypothetical protein
MTIRQFNREVRATFVRKVDERELVLALPLTEACVDDIQEEPSTVLTLFLAI